MLNNAGINGLATSSGDEGTEPTGLGYALKYASDCFQSSKNMCKINYYSAGMKFIVYFFSPIKVKSTLSFIKGNFFASKPLDSPASENENQTVDSSKDDSKRKIYPLNEDAESDDSGSGKP